MGDTYTQAYFHLVFAVQNRKSLIDKSWKPDLEKYITAIVKNQGHKLIAIGSMPDHIHILIGYSVKQTIPDLVNIIKTSSNQWIKENGFTAFRFSWQNGYGAFSHSRSQIDRVAKYVLNQEKHHSKKTFREEYIGILKRVQIKFKNEYLFDFIEENLDVK